MVLNSLAQGEDDLYLDIYILIDSTFRLKISEINSNRYQLNDVLDNEPKTKKFDSINYYGDNIYITSNKNIIIANRQTLKLEFYQNDVLVTVVNGNSLIMGKDAFAFGVQFPEAIEAYGLHEHAHSLALGETVASEPYRLRNLDVAGYELDSPMSLYGAVPVLYGHGVKATVGVFLHNAAQQFVDLQKQNGINARFLVESGELDLFIFLGPSPSDVVKQYASLTGVANLPQLWTLGYHQCRYSYYTQKEVLDVVANFDRYDFPLDAIWLDIDYTDKKKYFTWNTKTFPDPVKMQQNISSTDRKLVSIIDPHIKVEAGYSVYDEALKKGLFVKNANGSVFEGNCWPGRSSYIDFLSPEARAFVGSFYSYEKFPLTTPTLAGFWNDMNEPSVFDDSLEKTLPNDALHAGNVHHKDIHNIYGLLQTMSTHQGLLERDPDRRPFILTRSHFAGSQRYAIIWTGDNTADWGYLAASYKECLTASIAGISFCGADIGGFGGSPSEELLQRWYQAGAWLPFYRSHSSSPAPRREPYLYSKGMQSVIRHALRLRYQHLPVWYTLFYEHARYKEPVVRPLFYHYPQDVNTYKIDNQLLLGRDILVRPVMQAGEGSVKVYLPGGENEYWFELEGNHVYQGGYYEIPVNMTTIPIFYRRGSIIVKKAKAASSSVELMKNKPYTFIIILDENNFANATHYIDDTVTFKYKTNQEYNYRYIEARNKTLSVSSIDEDAFYGGDYLVTSETTYFIIDKNPSNYEPGTYKTKTYTKLANGQLLKDIKFQPSKLTMLHF